MAAEAKGVCTPQASVRDISTAVSIADMAKRKHKGICTTKSLETRVCISSLPRKKTSNFQVCIYKERESKLKPLHSQVCQFLLKYGIKNGEPDP